MTKYLFVSRGPGEISQASGLAKYVFARGGGVIFAMTQQENLEFVKPYAKSFKIHFAENPSALTRLVVSYRPDVVLFCNSKVWSDLLFSHPRLWEKVKEIYTTPISTSALVICIDSNWLFNDQKYPMFPYIRWATKYLINIHPEIFRMGLKENDGDFTLAENVIDKIEPVGSVPTFFQPNSGDRARVRQKYNIAPDEKMIFSYFSGSGGAEHRPWALSNLLAATELLLKKGRKIRILFVGHKRNANFNKRGPKWLIHEHVLSVDKYYSALSSSDLVFQHQGLATLTQALCAQVPVIANVSQQDKEVIRDLHFWEVGPFARAGICRMLSRSTPIHEIAEHIEQLLFNPAEREKMQEAQRKYFLPGEPRAYEIIQSLLAERRA